MTAVPGAGDRRPATVAAWLLLASGWAWTVANLVRTDPRRLPPIGDQPTYLLQALSLAHDHDAVYGAVDQARAAHVYAHAWPTGLFLVHHGSRWYFAKPATYAGWLAAWVDALGVRAGVAVANGLLLALVTVLVVAMLRRSHSGVVPPLVATAYLFTSNVFFSTYTVTADLLLTAEVALLCWAALHAWQADAPPRRQLAWATASLAVLGVLAVDKPPMLAIALPVAALVLWRTPGVRRLVPVAGLVVAMGVQWGAHALLVPGGGWHAYGGDRWLTANACFPGTAGSRALPWHTADEFSLSFARHALGHGWGHKALALWATLVGTRTGAVVFLPLVVTGVVVVLAQRRRPDVGALVLVATLALFVGFYAVFYPENYFGGAISIGNRYLVQVSPVVVAALAAARLPARRVVAAAGVAMVVGVLMLWPNLVDPAHAFWRADRRSFLQRHVTMSEQALFDARFTLDVDNTKARTEVPVCTGSP